MMKKKILELSSKFNIAQNLIEAYDWVVNPFPDIDGVTVDIDYGGSSGNQRIVLFPNSEQSIYHAYRYSVLASAFKLRGFKPIFILGHGRLPATILNYPTQLHDVASDELREYKTKKILNKFDHEWIHIKPYISKRNNIEKIEKTKNSKYKNIDVEKLSKASVRKLLKRYHIQDYQSIYTMFFRSGILLADVYEKIIDEYSPVVLIGNDDKYNFGGIPLRIASNNGIHAYSTASGWLNESLIVGNIAHRDTLPQFEKAGLVREFLENKLSEGDTEIVDNIMNERMSGRSENMVSYTATDSDGRSIELTKDDKTVGIFTNLIWDASLEAENCPYSDVFQWLQDTIALLEKQEGVEIIIKTHPAEKMRGTNESVSDWIGENMSLSQHIQVIKPGEDVNTYDLIDELDVAIVYNSTVGIEATYLGVPTITAGETHYRDLGITTDPNTREEYRSILSRLSDLEIKKEQISKSIRYLYFLFTVKHFSFPFVNHSNNSVRSVSTADIDETNVNFNQIISSCTNGNPVLNQDRKREIISPFKL